MNLSWTKLFNKCKYTLPFLLLFSGCADITKQVNTVIVQSVNDKEAKDIANAMSELSDADVKILYKQYTGIAEFVDNTNYVKNTKTIDNIIGVFPGIYNFSTSNEKWLNFIEKWLDSRNYSNKTIVESVSDETKEISKKQVIADFRILAEGAKLRLEQTGVNR